MSVHAKIDAGENPDPEDITKALKAVEAAEAKVENVYPANSRQRNESMKYLKSLHGLLRMMETPAINLLLAGVEKRPEATLGELMMFMQAYNLRFGPATTPRQQEVYAMLYPKLVTLRNEVAPALAAAPAPIDRADRLCGGRDVLGDESQGPQESRRRRRRPPAPGSEIVSRWRRRHEDSLNRNCHLNRYSRQWHFWAGESSFVDRADDRCLDGGARQMRTRRNMIMCVKSLQPRLRDPGKKPGLRDGRGRNRLNRPSPRKPPRFHRLQIRRPPRPPANRPWKQRLRKMEEMNQALSKTVQDLSKKLDGMSRSPATDAEITTSPLTGGLSSPPSAAASGRTSSAAHGEPQHHLLAPLRRPLLAPLGRGVRANLTRRSSPSKRTTTRTTGNASGSSCSRRTRSSSSGSTA